MSACCDAASDLKTPTWVRHTERIPRSMRPKGVASRKSASACPTSAREPTILLRQYGRSWPTRLKIKIPISCRLNRKGEVSSASMRMPVDSRHRMLGPMCK